MTNPVLKLTETQKKQLNDVVTQTRVTRGINAGLRNCEYCSASHFDMRSFSSLIMNQLVIQSEYHYDEWYATELGYKVWSEINKH